MRRYKTAKLFYDYIEDRLIVAKGIDILASSYDEAVNYCEEYHPDLVVCGEYDMSSETIRIGKYRFDFNYN